MFSLDMQETLKVLRSEVCQSYYVDGKNSNKPLIPRSVLRKLLKPLPGQKARDFENWIAGLMLLELKPKPAD